jgi:hypothetical protein
MKKALGFLAFLGLVFVFFLLLRECKSSGGGNTPLSHIIKVDLEFS